MSLIQFHSTMAFMLSFSGLVFHRKHLLSALICLEAMMLATYMGMSMWVTHMESLTSWSMPLMFLSISACEAGVGLAILVASSRTHGSTHLKALNLLKC
uniref:NADH-ubiquinone oxidoreductase chain 4L n=1 Tax=Monognathus jesperseni TaxID=556250 RepID=D1YUD4_9TELE|nr:NADH dehydrogenase subunit 4L [Monognathus jesperseni]